MPVCMSTARQQDPFRVHDAYCSLRPAACGARACRARSIHVHVGNTHRSSGEMTAEPTAPRDPGARAGPARGPLANQPPSWRVLACPGVSWRVESRRRSPGRARRGRCGRRARSTRSGAEIGRSARHTFSRASSHSHELTPCVRVCATAFAHRTRQRSAPRSTDQAAVVGGSRRGPETGAHRL